MRIPATQRPTKRVRDKLEVALCTLIDHEGDLADAFALLGVSHSTLGEICRALRLLVDGEA